MEKICITTPCATYEVCTDNAQITRIYPVNKSEPNFSSNVLLAKVTAAFTNYFAGRQETFDFHFDLTSCSPFQRRVLLAVRQIPYGQTRSYGQIAAMIGQPKAVRAVASAVARNKFIIAIPCHRVIRTDGKIGKYSDGSTDGIANKRKLLALERTGRWMVNA